MGYYRNLYNKCEAENIKAWEVLVVYEVEAWFDNLTEEQFEIVCDFVYDWVMNSAASTNELCSVIEHCLVDGEFVIEDMVHDYEKVRTAVNNRF